MKARRYLHPSRHLDEEEAPVSMNYSDDIPGAPVPAEDGSAAPDALQVDVGRAMPPAQPDQLPVLAPTVHAAPAEIQDTAPGGRSMLAEGLHFVGNALLTGPCSIAGEVDGNLTQAPGTSVAVIVTETGRVKGDITAHKISVMGRTEGVLDSGPGEVALHDTASVHGLVRYGRIQVNGADLNATLERVPVARN